MAELIKFEKVELPALRVIGKPIVASMSDMSNNPIPAFWQSCFADGTLTRLEAMAEHIHDPSYVGCMCRWGGPDGTFTYIVGMLMKAGTPAPEGYDFEDMAAGSAAVGWIKGKEPAIYQVSHVKTESAMEAQGLVMDPDRQWCMELYNCPRFTTPDENGDKILDYYIPCVAKA